MNQPQANKTTSMGGSAGGQTNSVASSISFTSDAIGKTKASKPNNYFTEQNRKSQEKQAAKSENSKKAIRITGIIGGAVLGTVIIAGTVFLLTRNKEETSPAMSETTITELSQSTNSETSRKFQQDAQAILDGGGAVESVGELYDQQFSALQAAVDQDVNHDTSVNNSAFANLVILEMQTYNSNSYPHRVIETAKRVDERTMQSFTAEQRAIIYGLIYDSYMDLNDMDKAKEYLKLYNANKPQTNGNEIKVAF